MQKTLSSRQKVSNFSALLLLAAFSATLVGCGSGTPAGTADTGGTTVTTTTLTPTPTLTLALNNASGTPVTFVSSNSPGTVEATVLDAAGDPVVNTIITFSVDDGSLAIVSPITALTDSLGVATVTLSAASLSASGATTITATGLVQGTTVTASKSFSVGATTISLSAVTFGVGSGSLSAFGTTSVSVTVYFSGVPVSTPQIVTFTSPCSTSGKAALTTSVSTVSGIATASYRDIGCGGTDTVTATVGGISSSATLTVIAPTAGSIRFISATPTSITLKGSGGAGRQESSQVVFMVANTGGGPIGGKVVDFTLSTSVGGITFSNGLTAASAVSDAISGQAVITVNAGTFSTPVRVIATTSASGVTLTTQSDQLTITTGIPDQDSFDLAASKFNIEGWGYTGETTVLTASLADHFNNPALDGTAVNFTTEGGAIVGSCSTAAGVCTSTLTSQNPRPANGRLTVLAYAVGEESFTDKDGDGWADESPNEQMDANGDSTDLAEPYVDYNENGSYDVAASGVIGEPFTDTNTSGTFNAGDTHYNGILCNETAGSSPGTCGPAGTSKAVHVRGATVIVFSGSVATISGVQPSLTLDECVTGVTFQPVPQTVTATIHDLHGNSMPIGTTVVFTSNNATITPASFTVGNTTACLEGFGPPGFICPTSSEVSFGTAPLAFQVSVNSDATQDAATLECTNPKKSGALTITVTTPKGVVTSKTIPVTD